MTDPWTDPSHLAQSCVVLDFFNLQYVGVASGQKEVMLLGGNLPGSLSKYLLPGHDHDSAGVLEAENDEKNEKSPPQDNDDDGLRRAS